MNASHCNCVPLRCDRARRYPTLSQRRCPQGRNRITTDRFAIGRTAAGLFRFEATFLLADRLEPVDSPGAGFDSVKIVPRIHGDTMSLGELTRQVSDLSQTRQEFAGLTFDYIDPRIILVDDEHECLGCIA